MSEATRCVALAEAVKFCAGAELSTAMQTAQAFFDFLNNESPKTMQTHSTPTTSAKTPAVDKPKKDVAAKAAAKTEAVLKAEMMERVKATETAANVTTREMVGKAVENMLKANKREEAKGLLKQFGATSVSSVPEDDYEAFVLAADGILAGDEMTA